ncbi:hypothetical protein [Paenibacillus dakarensis]|uniref:hypothetical protein n=1 Tax=Paenibacillus dakarensis TaxID=1527293 RepID=UPI000AA2FC7D|nr:hypothetical protein [Paenibacillus dakarensis]
MDSWIYIVLLGIAAILYAFMLPKRREDTVNNEQIIKEVESTLEQYMNEIQLENEQLLELVGQMKQEQSAKHTVQQEQINEMRQRLLAAEQQLSSTEARMGIMETALSAKGNDPLPAGSSGSTEPTESEKITQPPVNSIKRRYTSLFDMYEDGKSIDMIAKSTGMQRGEVQLIIQLAKQEETP